jgi:hypothetical protein
MASAIAVGFRFAATRLAFAACRMRVKLRGLRARRPRLRRPPRIRARPCRFLRRRSAAHRSPNCPAMSHGTICTGLAASRVDVVVNEDLGPTLRKPHREFALQAPPRSRAPRSDAISSVRPSARSRRPRRRRFGRRAADLFPRRQVAGATRLISSSLSTARAFLAILRGVVLEDQMSEVIEPQPRSVCGCATILHLVASRPHHATPVRPEKGDTEVVHHRAVLAERR